MEFLFLNLLQLRDILGSHILFTIGAMLLMGYALGTLVDKIGLPEISGYIIAGIVLGGSVLGIVPFEMTSSMKIITEIALGLIALTIGSEFSFTKIKRMGKSVLSITLFQLVIVFTAIFFFMQLTGLDTAFALIIAAIGTASSPAVIVAVVQSLRLRGSFVDCLYGVIALLDAGTVILFGIVFSFAAGMLGVTEAGKSSISLFYSAISEIILSLIIGIIMALIIHYSIHKKRRETEILLIILGIAFTFTAFAIVFHLSPLLINMTAGAMLVNISARHNRIFRVLEPLTPPIYALFFILAGSELRISILLQRHILIMGGVYILSRSISKYLGVYAGAAFAKCSTKIKHYLGFCMFPQAGVSLGLILFVQASPISHAMSYEQIQVTNMLVNIILFSVFFNQIFGPPLAKYALMRGSTAEG